MTRERTPHAHIGLFRETDHAVSNINILRTPTSDWCVTNLHRIQISNPVTLKHSQHPPGGGGGSPGSPLEASPFLVEDILAITLFFITHD